MSGDHYLEDLDRANEPEDPWYVHLAKVLVGFAACLGICLLLAKVIQP